MEIITFQPKFQFGLGRDRASNTDEVSGFDSQHFRASASDGICSAVRVVEVRLEGEPAQMGFEVPSVAMTMAEYLGMLELTRALRYTWHSHTNLIPGLTFMLAVSFRLFSPLDRVTL
ncbi:hypothetical protein DKX38_015487 [Salix brachista]|uniref:Uncharacterized protein n=1 Tax=Salix brachista TaxID=2182728 RepID=A0A5N5L5C5_9ROSI|nr:hypothetical protein DKX38_015487 [Salix brachista]